MYDWQTGGRQLSEEERKIARWLAKSSPVEKMDGRREAEKVEKEAA